MSGATSLISSPEPPTREEGVRGLETGAGRRRRRPPSGLVAAVALVATCGGLAGSSLLLPATPTTDPWGWIVWGREAAHLRIDTAVGGPPSWKPLPVILTTPLSLFGSAAPGLWLGLARGAGLGALVVAFLLGRRIAGWPAGALGALALPLLPEWTHGFLHGYSEGLLVLLVLGAVELGLRGRLGAALVLGVLAGLDRPEAWPFVAFYAAALWRRGRVSAPLAGLALAAMPLLWFGGDLLGSGDAFHGSRSAAAVARQAGLSVRGVLSQAFGGGLLAVTVLAVPALAGAVRSPGPPVSTLPGALRSRDRLVAVLAVGSLAWIGLVVGLVALGYPASPRFLVAPEAALCVLAGAGAVAVFRAAPGPRYRAAAGLALVGVGAGLALGRGEQVVSDVSAAPAQASLQRELQAAARRVRDRVPPGAMVALPPTMHWSRGAVAWELRLPLRNVQGVRPRRGRRPATASDSILIASPRLRRATLVRADGWRVCALPARTSTPRALASLWPACERRGGRRPRASAW